jgi:hypothetical protein
MKCYCTLTIEGDFEESPLIEKYEITEHFREWLHEALNEDGKET